MNGSLDEIARENAGFGTESFHWDKLKLVSGFIILVSILGLGLGAWLIINGDGNNTVTTTRRNGVGELTRDAFVAYYKNIPGFEKVDATLMGTLVQQNEWYVEIQASGFPEKFGDLNAHTRLRVVEESGALRIVTLFWLDGPRKNTSEEISIPVQ